MIRLLKSIVYIGLVLISAHVHGFGTQHPGKSSKPNNSSLAEPKFMPLLEFKAGYFFFSDSKMRKIYDEGGLDVQLCGSYPVWKWLQIYGSVEYLQRHGKSLHSHEKTSIWEVPISLGLKPVIPICSTIQYYLTIGPRYFFVHTHMNSPYMDKDLNQNGLGGFVNMGFNFFPCRHLLLDVFGEYSYKRMQFHTSKSNSYGSKVQVGGFAFGAGIGYAF